ncbi:hypothetical protein HBE96_15415 [Clostridium sp. P21]|uniref:Uncharacterized protein n=1 Tax=Clostridium muellerianum TaxID=2716538 RepID=A0A7Y0HPA8_9CLOT|nr:hypothetical protein [Clostridium muellerianum]NMM64035.1 hypothetical protein [Clostridium muellerianum]
MSVVCKALIGPFEHTSNCECTLVDFDLTIKGLCNGTRYGIVAVVKCNSLVVATVCRIFDVNVPSAGQCTCVDVPLEFRKIIVDEKCCTDETCVWDVDVVCANYILGCCSLE